MATEGTDYDLDTFTAAVITPQGRWIKVRVLVAGGAASVVAPGVAGQPEVVLTRRVESLSSAGGRWWVDVAGDDGAAEQWVVDAPCGCGSPAKRWGTDQLIALAADARARAAG